MDPAVNTSLQKRKTNPDSSTDPIEKASEREGKRVGWKKSKRTFSPLPWAELLKLPTFITGSASEAAAGGKKGGMGRRGPYPPR